MRFTGTLTGLNRVLANRKKYRSKYEDNSWYYKSEAKSEMSEDTKIRKDINETIIKMIAEGKNDVQIELYLTNMYPNYSEYILKMISHQFSKINASKAANYKDGKTGETR